LPEHARPTALADALQLLTQQPWSIVAGGTDYYPAQGERPIDRAVLDVTAIDELRGIEQTGLGWRIGATATFSELIKTDLPPAFRALVLAAREVGSIQIQNRATVAGNLCNSSPAADSVPPLLAMQAQVELASSAGNRLLPLQEFITGNRRNARAASELLTAIYLPHDGCAGVADFLKLGARKYLVISIAMVAVRLASDDTGTITDASIAIGACSEVATRLNTAEQRLIGAPLADQPENLIDADMLGQLQPIDDVRASADYRVAAALQLTRRSIANCVELAS
jgi:CO/xanthine dehydrogenase FAD-binding subunit